MLAPNSPMKTTAAATPNACFSRGRADAQEAMLLRIEAGARTIRITNLLLLSGEPAVLDTIVIAAAMFPDLTEARFRARDSTIYHFYQTHYGINVVRTHERLRAGTADRKAARELGIAPGAPVLITQMYFAGEALNDRDEILLDVRRSVGDDAADAVIVAFTGSGTTVDPFVGHFELTVGARIDPRVTPFLD